MPTPTRSTLVALLLASAAVLGAGCASHTVHHAAGTASPLPHRVAFDFNNGDTWPDFSVASTPNTTARVARAPVGTIDTYGTSAPSTGMLLYVDASKNTGPWNAFLTSGPIAVSPGETNLGKLTLAFMLSASSNLPVAVRIESLNASAQPTGTLEGTIYPAAPNFYQRYALDLSTLKPTGPGTFDPAAKSIRLSFGIQGGPSKGGTGTQPWPAAAGHELHLDNVQYAGPAFYVSPTGKDTNDGRTEKTPFATPQRALDLAGPGDIILLGQGTYTSKPIPATLHNGGLAPPARFVRAGTPAEWIVLKNYPGHKPMLTGNSWDIVMAKYGTKEQRDSTHTLAYLEIRGLHVRGDADKTREKFPETLGQSNSRSNSNGIVVNGYYMDNPPHHIRIADNLVEYVPGGGMGTLECDYVFIENNTVRYTSWHTIYGTSGISTLGAANFDTADNVYKILVRNNTSYGNETFVVCKPVKRLTDGNGIIIDVNQNTANRPNEKYIGRTLVTGNLCFDNGGSGIHTVTANRVDIFNNTAYLNSASAALQYGQIYATYKSTDVRIFNNIMVAPVADPAFGEKPEPLNPAPGNPANVVYSHNIYFGGNIPPTMGEGDRIADPEFVNPTRNPALADFSLKPTSPALKSGTTTPWVSPIDLKGNPRPATTAPDIGAIQH